MTLGRWRSFCNPAIVVTPVTTDSRFDGTFRRCFDDPAAAALFRLGDARIRDDASPQPRGRADLAGSNGECALVHLPNLDEPTGAAAALLQLPRPLRTGALRAVAAADIAVARIRAEPGGAGLRHPIPARPPRSHDAHLRQFSPHRCRLLRLSAVGLFRSFARTRRRADAGFGRRLGSRDDRPAFLAEGTPLVRAPAFHRSRRRRARPRSIATRRDRSGSASYCSSRRPKLDPRANNPAVAGDPEHPRDRHRTTHLVFCRYGWGGIAGARRPSHLAASAWPRAHRLS